MLTNFRKKPDLTSAKIPHTGLRDGKYYFNSNSLYESNCVNKKSSIKSFTASKILKLPCYNV